MILAESSVWIDHLRRGNTRLDSLLREGRVVIHTMVIGELACGSLRQRSAALREWWKLPRLESVGDAAATRFIEEKRLMNRGIGFIDVHLLAAVAQTGRARLWSHDKRLASIATELGLAFQPHDA